MTKKVNDEGVIVSPPSSVEIALEKNDLEGAVQALAKDPESFKAFLKSTELALSESKDQAGVIRDRNFFKRLFTSNTSELAKILLEQNDVMTRFYVILQLLTLQTKGNAGYLKRICEAIKLSSDVEGQEQGNLQKIAINFLEQTIEAAKAEEVRDRALMKLLKAAEQTAVFEQSIREAHHKVEEQYLESSINLKQEFDGYKKTLDDDLAGFKKEITNAYENQQRLLEEKATPGQIKNSIDILATDINKMILEQSQAFQGEVHYLKTSQRKQIFVVGVISFLALVAGIVSLFI